MAGWEFVVLVAKKGCFGEQYGRAGVDRKLLFYENWEFLRTAKKDLCKWKVFWFAEEKLLGYKKSQRFQLMQGQPI